MATQHTAEPWTADKWAPGWTVSAPDAHYSVCHLEDCNNAEANAQLIAAAPDLLEACKFTKAQIQKGAQKKALPILRAAIALATRKNN